MVDWTTKNLHELLFPWSCVSSQVPFPHFSSFVSQFIIFTFKHVKSNNNVPIPIQNIARQQVYVDEKHKKRDHIIPVQANKPTTPFKPTQMKGL